MDIQQLFQDYDSSDMRKRLDAIRELEQRQVVEAVPVLLRALHDTAFEVRVHAAIALGRLGDVRAVGALLLVVHDSRLDRHLLPSIWAGLAATQDPRATEALVDLLDVTTDSGLRHELVRLLGRTRDSRIFEMLLRLLDDQDPLIAVAAAQALADYGDTRAVPLLRQYMRDPDERVRNAIIGAIRSLRGH